MFITFVKQDVLSFRLRAFYFFSEQQFSYKAGQYIQIRLPHETVDDRGSQRFFTIASSPQEKYLMILTSIQEDPERMSSFKKQLVQLEVGKKIEIAGPFGTFVLE